jgi:predicted nucleic acid-binding protein
MRFAELVRALPITVDNTRLDRALGIVLDLARTYHLTSYDALYLELAMREAIPLATQDAQLRSAATRLGVQLLT